MKKYHIVYYENEKDIYALGVTITANSYVAATLKFYFQFPEVKFHSMTIK